MVEVGDGLTAPCPECGKEIGSDEAICPYCDYELDQSDDDEEVLDDDDGGDEGDRPAYSDDEIEEIQDSDFDDDDFDKEESFLNAIEKVMLCS